MPKRNRGHQSKASAKESGPAEISFEFIKSAFFRVISVEGAFGGLSPTGRSIHMAIFSERRPIPRKTVHPLMDDGSLGEELKDRRESRESFVREIEADLVLDLPTAIGVHQWLGNKIQELAKISEKPAKPPTKKGKPDV